MAISNILLKHAIVEAKNVSDKDVILFNLSGHGHYDPGAYDCYNKGELKAE